MRKLINKIVPSYAIIPIIICLAWNCMVYYGARLFYSGRYFYDMTTSLEENIPVIPLSVFIYYLFFPFLAVIMIIIARKSKEDCYHLIVSDMMAKAICFIIFVSIPTTNVRPHIIGSGIASVVMRRLYRVDAANNLFPSIHCMDSWLFFLVVKKSKYCSKKYQWITWIVAVLICGSTLTTKQHVIADVIAGIALAEIAWYFGGWLIGKIKIEKNTKI